MILDGKKTAKDLLERIHIDLMAFLARHPNNPLPTLAVVLVGKNPASLAYIKMKKKRAEEVGMNFFLKTLDAHISQTELENTVATLASQSQISGIIVQAPLPNHLNIASVIEKIPPHKDVDGFSHRQIGNMFLGREGLYSCTPKGIMTLL